MNACEGKHMPNIVRIVEEKRCYGCASCYNSCVKSAITMERDEQGFSIPRVDKSKCVNCGVCDTRCPARKENFGTTKDTSYTQKVYSVRLKDTAVRKVSSSGGLFTALSTAILERGGYVSGAVWDEHFNVRHCITTDTSVRDKMRQSKYIQSEIGDCFCKIRKQLKDNKYVLFTGTPCQTAALKLFLKGENTDRLILCDVLCGGNVSPLFFHDYLDYIENRKNDKVKSVCFRTKKIGWKQHHICVELNHSIYEGARRDNEPFFDLYLKKMIIRPSCFSCQFAGTERNSDLTLGDFWGIDKVDPDVDDDIGISFLSVNTLKGAELFENVKGNILFEKRDINLVIPRQINLQHAPIKPERYDKFWREYIEEGASVILKRYTTFGFINGLVNRIKSIIKSI